MRARTSARTPWVAVMTTVVVATVIVAGCGGDSGSVGESTLRPFPDPAPLATPAVRHTDFAGAEACAECHEAQYTAWSRSTHGRAGGEPDLETVIAPFDGRPIRFADATVTPRVRDGSFEFVVAQRGFAETTFPVAGAIGRAHMRGGGTQGYVHRHADGTERLLPWEWSGTGGFWFCNTETRAGRGWQPITPDMRLADCGDWPPLRVLGTVDRFANCQECHGSQIRTTLAPGRGYETDHTSLRVNCESCHGPARRHVEMARSGDFGTDGDIGIASLAWLDKESSLQVCFQCHGLKDVLKEGYLPGEPFEAYFALKYPVLGDEPYFADGRVRTFAYQANHLASACYLQGPMDCVSCHEPHGQGYQNVDRRPLEGPYDDGQCTSCHASKGADPTAHTHHPADSEGSRCVSCHMPYLQHPEVGDEVPFARSDHTIAVPRPVFDDDLGIESACAGCHAEIAPLELQRSARAWWGEPKPHRTLIAGITGEFRARNAAEAAELLLRPGETDPLTQFQALGRLLTRYLRADAGLTPEVRERLETLASDEDLDVSSLALASLHWSGGDEPEVRDVLVDALERAPSDEALRGRWSLALGFLGDRARDAGDFATAGSAYRKALELRPEDARVLHSLGQMHNREGSYARAADVIRRSLAADPEQPLAWVNLGVALAGAGDPAGAREAYREALALNPHEALALFNLGNVEQRAGRFEEAARSYARAIEADPGLGLAHFELARTYLRLERPGDALPHARRAVEFLPSHDLSRQMLADLERVLGGP